MKIRKYKHIIWDWNGTLLDDAWLCVQVMNGMLKKRDLPVIDIEQYRNIFDFPVRDYYRKLGFDFDKEEFKIVGMDFMILYNERQKECSLHPEVKSILEEIRQKGYRQSILSAREEQELRKETIDLGVNNFFDFVYGLDDHYAHGKTDVGIRLLDSISLPKEDLLFIGDTIHDAEVAKELGIDCILVPNGHMSEERLRRCQCSMIKSLGELNEFL